MATRWDSALEMMESVKSDLPDLKAASESNKRVKNLLSQLDTKLLDTFIKFLDKFKKARLSLSYESLPTMDRVVNTCLRLRYFIQKQTLFSLSSKYLVDIFDAKVTEKLNVNHYLACCLNPQALSSWKNQRYLKFNGDFENAIKDRLRKIESSGLQNNPTTEIVEVASSSEQCEDSDFDEFMQPAEVEPFDYKKSNEPSEPTELTLLDEFDKYMRNSDSITHSALNVLDLWDDLKKDYPKLHRVSLYVFSMQATNNSSERIFNGGKELLTPKSNRTLDDVFGNRLFINKNNDIYLKISFDRLKQYKCPEDFKDKVLAMIENNKPKKVKQLKWKSNNEDVEVVEEEEEEEEVVVLVELDSDLSEAETEIYEFDDDSMQLN